MPSILYKIIFIIAVVISVVTQAQELIPRVVPGPKAPTVRPIGLATYDPPSPGALNGSDFVVWIQEQVKNGAKELALRQGAYHVTPGVSNPQAHIYFHGFTGLTVYIDSVNLTMTVEGLTAIYVDTCATFTLIGGTTWWDTPGFSQATITNVKTSGSNYTIEYKEDAGYDPSFLVTSEGVLNNVEYTNPYTGLLQAGPGWSTLTGNPVPVAGTSDTYTFSVAINSVYYVPQIGFKLLARGNFLMCNEVNNSNDTTIQDYTLLNCGGFGYFSTANRATKFVNFQLKPAPFPPPGGTQLPVRSSSADGIHSGNDIIGPTWDSCYFEALDDDCMAVHGTLYTIQLAGPSSNTFWGQTDDPSAVGETLRFYEPGSYVILGTAEVTGVTKLPGGPVDSNLLTVTSLPKGVAVGTLYVNRNRVGSGFQVLNTVTKGNRGNGLVAKASNGYINNNWFQNAAYTGITIGPAFTYWHEADFVNNVTVTNNGISDCNYIDQAQGALELHGDGWNVMGGNTDVHFAYNLVYNTTAANLYIGGSSNVSLMWTSFEEAYTMNFSLWGAWPGSVENVATFANVSFTTIHNNCVKGSLPHGIGFNNFLGENEGISNATGVAYC